MKYIEKGICIWCKRTIPECSFNEQPHTLPKSLGGQHIGVDICDECNHYFGQADKLSTPQLRIDECFKEIFSIIRFMLYPIKSEHSYKELKSIYFEYRHSKNRIIIKKSFKLNTCFLKIFARQFKRGIYEIFLQEFHRQTHRGLEDQFNNIRNFARYNKGDLPIYHILNNGILLTEQNLNAPQININSKTIEDIDTYGFYNFYLMGHFFFLEVTPRAELTRDIYLNNKIKDLNIGGVINTDLIKINSITDIDFTLRNLHDI